MTRNLYVGNLSTDSTEPQLRELFSQAGEINDLTIISDQSTGRSRGFGFVEMTTDEGAQEAILNLVRLHEVQRAARALGVRGVDAGATARQVEFPRDE